MRDTASFARGTASGYLGSRCEVRLAGGEPGAGMAPGSRACRSRDYTAGWSSRCCSSLASLYSDYSVSSARPAETMECILLLCGNDFD